METGRSGEGVVLRQLGPSDPAQVGEYRLLGLLGTGGMGRVYLGRSPGGRTVAVKVVRPELLDDPRFRERFHREVAAARRVGGEFTAPVIDADTDGTPPWFATGYVSGYPLGEAVARFGPLPEWTLRVLASGLARALLAIHSAGVVHRDLKPSNVLLAADGPRVIDFGIARASNDGGLTTTGKLLGSPGYMSPEQITGVAPPGPAGDVFSLGGVLAYAALGYSAFGEGPTVPMLWRIVQEPPELTAVPGGLREIIAACLAKDPAQRPGPAELLTLLGPVSTDDWLPGTVLTAISRRAGALLNLEPAPPLAAAAPEPVAMFSSPSNQVVTRPAGLQPRPSAVADRRRGLQYALAALVLSLVLAVLTVGALVWRPGAPATASGGEEPGSAAGALPANFAGTWKGTADLPLLSFDIELTLRPGAIGAEIGNSVNTGRLSKVRCARAEKLSNVSGAGVMLAARLVEGTGCTDDGAVTVLTMRPDGTLSYDETSPLGNMRGTLRRVR